MDTFQVVWEKNLSWKIQKSIHKKIRTSKVLKEEIHLFEYFF